MEELKLTRLMTLDEVQANAARALNYRVLRPAGLTCENNLWGMLTPY